MYHQWAVTIEVWPCSTGEGGAADRKACGAEYTDHMVNAEDIAEAMEKADFICIGIRHNPRVWKTNITAIVQNRD